MYRKLSSSHFLKHRCLCPSYQIDLVTNVSFVIFHLSTEHFWLEGQKNKKITKKQNVLHDCSECLLNRSEWSTSFNPKFHTFSSGCTGCRQNKSAAPGLANVKGPTDKNVNRLPLVPADSVVRIILTAPRVQIIKIHECAFKKKKKAFRHFSLTFILFSIRGLVVQPGLLGYGFGPAAGD